MIVIKKVVGICGNFNVKAYSLRGFYLNGVWSKAIK